MKKKMSLKKKLLIVLAVVVVALVIVDIIASNYLVSFAIERKENIMEHAQEVVPEYENSEEDLKIIRQNSARMWEEANAWIETEPSEVWEIASEDGLKLKALYKPIPEGSHKYAICIHGYMSSRAGMYDVGAEYAKKGYNVLLPDMRAHGESEGRFVGMGWLDRKDVLLWIDKIIETDPRAEIVLHGISMGAATAMMVSGEELPENVICIIEDCGYTSVWDIFSDELAYIFHLPDFPLLYTASAAAKLRAGYTFGEASALEQVKKTSVPILFMHGDTDTFVKTDMVYKLYDACPSYKDIYVVTGAGHGQAAYRDPEGYFNKTFGFIEEVKTLDK